MSKTITVSDETYELIKEQVESESKEEKKVGIEIKTMLGTVRFTSTKTTQREAILEAVASDANLRGADLRDADLREADLRGADLRGADLRGANLLGAYLRDADLRDADLRDAYLRDAYLLGADLREADLRGADLRDADLMNAKFYGKGGTKPLKKEQVPVFLKALGFVIEG